MKYKKKVNKTFINPKLIQFTREFSDEEIKNWQKEDILPRKLFQNLKKSSTFA